MSVFDPKEGLFDLLSQIVIQGLRIDAAILKLQQTSRMPNYAATLMQIINDERTPLPIKQTGLEQLFAHIRFYWKQRISEQEKRLIKDWIIPSYIRAQQNLHEYYEQILSSIVSYQYKTWLPVQMLLSELKEGKNIRSILIMLLAIQKAFEKIYEKQTNSLSNFQAQALPILLLIAESQQDHYASYLSFKFYHRAVLEYNEKSNYGSLLLDWMPFLQYFVNGSNKQVKQGYKYSNDITKAKRQCLRIYNTYLNRNQRFLPNRMNSLEWYSKYGERFISILVPQLEYGYEEDIQIRLSQLQCICKLFDMPQQVIHYYSKNIQNSRALEKSMLDQSCPKLNQLSMSIWIRIFYSNLPLQTQQGQISNNLQDNINYLKKKLVGNHKQRQVALIIIGQLYVSIQDYKSWTNLMKIWGEVISNFVIPNLQYQNLKIQVQAMKVISLYCGRFQFVDKRYVLKIIIPYILRAQNPILSLKAAQLFPCLLQPQAAKKLEGQLLNELMETYIYLFQTTQSYVLARRFRSIANLVPQPFLVKMVDKIVNLYITSRGILKDYSRYMEEEELIESLLDIFQNSEPSFLISMWNSIKRIVVYFFSEMQCTTTRSLLNLLKAYICRVQFLTEDILSIYDMIINYIIGKDPQNWELNQQLRGIQFHFVQDEQDVRMQADLRGIIRDNIPVWDVLPVIKLYFQNVAKSQINRVAFSNRQASFICFFASNKGDNGFPELMVHRQIYTLLLISYLQQFKGSAHFNVYTQIWEFARFNLVNHIQGKNTLILLSLLLWCAPYLTLQLIQRQGMLNYVIQLINEQTRDDFNEYELAPVILGLTQMVKLASSEPIFLRFLSNQLPLIFQILCQLVNISVNQSRRSKKGHEFWVLCQERPLKTIYEYYTLLKTVDQLQNFQMSLRTIGQQNNPLYLQLVLVNPNWTSFEQSLDQAISVRRLLKRQ